MVKRITLLICLSLVSIILCGCIENQPDPLLIASSISNSSSEFSLGEPVELILTNNTNYCIVIPLDKGVLILAEQGEQWVEVRNLISFIGDQNFTLYADGEIFSTRGLPLRPDTSTLIINKATKFIAHLTGYLCEDNSIEIQKKIQFTIIP